MEKPTYIKDNQIRVMQNLHGTNKKLDKILDWHNKNNYTCTHSDIEGYLQYLNALNEAYFHLKDLIIEANELTLAEELDNLIVNKELNLLDVRLLTNRYK